MHCKIWWHALQFELMKEAVGSSMQAAMSMMLCTYAAFSSCSCSASKSATCQIQACLCYIWRTQSRQSGRLNMIYCPKVVQAHTEYGERERERVCWRQIIWPSQRAQSCSTCSDSYYTRKRHLSLLACCRCIVDADIPTARGHTQHGGTQTTIRSLTVAPWPTQSSMTVVIRSRWVIWSDRCI